MYNGVKAKLIDIPEIKVPSFCVNRDIEMQEKDTERVLQTLPSNELQVITFHCNPKEKGKTLN